ncbi:MAG TPA: TlpA disulfide reductase family protein, partial [Terriglobales bacterium]|nr:TlpA disulfide reductase family protein [Terriglobales bacterium]
MKRVWALIVAAGLLLGLAAVYHHQHRPAEFASAVHPMAPDFDVTAIDGKKLSLVDYRGKVVLLDFWATWCTPCREEIPRFVQLQEKYGQQRFQI